MSKREPKLLLSDILSSIYKIKVYTENYIFETFIEDSKAKRKQSESKAQAKRKQSASKAQR